MLTMPSTSCSLIDGRRLRRLRLDRELTQGQLALKSGVPQAHISRIESGRFCNLKLSTLSKLAMALNVGFDDLLPSDTPPPPPALPPIDLSSPDVRLVLARIAELPNEDQAMIWEMIRPLVERAAKRHHASEAN